MVKLLIFLIFRLTFIFVLVFSIIFCFQAIKSAYKLTDTNPILFKIDDKIWNAHDVREKLQYLERFYIDSFQIPFPAITICPDLEIDRNRFFEIEADLKNQKS